LLAPFAVTFGTRDTELQPDVLVARYGDLTAKNLPSAPVLAVEVRSPSTGRSRSRSTRRSFAGASTPTSRDTRSPRPR
jgi:Uma2 family endonuclease